MAETKKKDWFSFDNLVNVVEAGLTAKSKQGGKLFTIDFDKAHDYAAGKSSKKPVTDDKISLVRTLLVHGSLTILSFGIYPLVAAGLVFGSKAMKAEERHEQKTNAREETFAKQQAAQEAQALRQQLGALNPGNNARPAAPQGGRTV